MKKQEKAFKELKEKFIKELVLTIPDLDIIETSSIPIKNLSRRWKGTTKSMIEIY